MYFLADLIFASYRVFVCLPATTTITSPPSTSADLTPVPDAGPTQQKIALEGGDGGIIEAAEGGLGVVLLDGGGLGSVAEKVKGDGKVEILSPEDAAEKTPEHRGGMNGKLNGDAYDKKKVSSLEKYTTIKG